MTKLKRNWHVGNRYDALATNYDRRWGAYVEASVRATLGRMSLSPNDRLLDVGCGTGALLAALEVRRPDVEMVGVDLSTAMLNVARRRLPRSVRLLVADAETLPLARNSFDVVVSSSSFHYWSSPVSALRELRRILRPGGRVVITDWCDDYLACRVCDRVLRWVDPAHRSIYGSRDCADLLDRSDYKLERLDRYRISWLWGLMTAVASAPRLPESAA